MPNALTAAILNRPDNPFRQVSPKLADAIRAVIHEGLTLEEAAKRAGLSTFRIRQSFDERHVQKFIRDEKQMRLESVRLSNINALAAIRDNGGAAGVSAVRVLEEMGSPVSHVAGTVAASTPGVTINIVSALPANSGQVDERQPVIIEGEASSLVEPSSGGEQSGQ